MAHLLIIALAILATQPESSPPSAPDIRIRQPGEDPGFADAIVAIERTNAAPNERNRAAGVLLAPDLLAVPLDMVVGDDDLNILTFDCQPTATRGVVGVEEQAGIALVRLDAPLPLARALPDAPAPEPGEDVIVGAVMPILDCGFAVARSHPVEVLSRRDWAGRGELLHIAHWNPLAALASPLITADDHLQGLIVDWGGAETSLVVPMDRVRAIPRFDPIPLPDFTPDRLAAPTQARLIAHGANHLRDNGDFRAAMTAATKAIKLDPDCWLAYYVAGVCTDEQGNTAPAAEALQRSIDIEPGFCESWYSLGLVRLHAGDPQSAIEPLQRATDIDPRYAPAIAMLALAHFQVGDTDAAVKIGERALDADDVKPEHYTNLIIFYQRLDRPDDALRIASRWTIDEPREAHAWSELGHLQFSAEDYEHARIAFRRAAELDPDDVHTWTYLAVTEAELGDIDKARDAVDHALQLDPTDQLALEVKRLFDHPR